MNNKDDKEGKVMEGESRTLISEGRRSIHSINPLGMRILVRIPKDDNMSDGGLYLPEGAKDAMAESLLVDVIEVASAVDLDTEEETNVSGIPLGAKVLIPKQAGIGVPWDATLRIVDTKDVLAVVDKVSLS